MPVIRGRPAAGWVPDAPGPPIRGPCRREWGPERRAMERIGTPKGNSTADTTGTRFASSTARTTPARHLRRARRHPGARRAPTTPRRPRAASTRSTWWSRSGSPRRRAPCNARWRGTASTTRPRSTCRRFWVRAPGDLALPAPATSWPPTTRRQRRGRQRRGRQPARPLRETAVAAPVDRHGLPHGHDSSRRGVTIGFGSRPRSFGERSLIFLNGPVLRPARSRPP
jgi:hypothetical protein